MPARNVEGVLSGLRPHHSDAMIAAAVGVVAVCSTVIVQGWPGSPPAAPLVPSGLVVIAAAVVPLAWRSRYPVAVAAVSTTASTLYYPLGFPDGVAGLAGVIALFGAAADGYRWQSWSLGIAQFLVLHTLEGLVYGAPRLGQALLMLQMVMVVLITAEVVRRRREYRTLARERADEAGRTREEVILRRASEERVQLAREVHDAVAHNISLINVQAGTALYLIDAEPERAADALATIKRTSRDTLQELRATLNVLRFVDEEAPRSPAPGLDRIEELAAGTRGAGLDVRVVRTGGSHPASANVESAAYRIVQEALTNVVRHADAATVTVEVEREDTAVRVQIRDDGTAPAAGITPGNGITGMRERVAALGGEIVAGHEPGGGFAVRARLPDLARPAGPAEHREAEDHYAAGGGSDTADRAGATEDGGSVDDLSQTDSGSAGTRPQPGRKERRR